MEVSEERLQEMIHSAVAEAVENAKPIRHSEWNELRKDITAFIDELVKKPGVNPWTLREATNALIRYKLGIKNVNSIDESNVEEARQVFEQVKQIIGGDPHDQRTND